jgi:hypothetical protein
MISRKLTRRLERLEFESRLQPAAEPNVITIEYVDKDRRVVDRKEITVPAPAPNGHGQRTRPWRGY